MKFPWRWMSAIVIIALIITGIAYVQLRTTQETQVRTATVTRETVVQNIIFSGSVQSVREADLGFETTGTLVAIHVEEGEQVEEGQLLAQLDPASAELSVAKTTADRASAQESARVTLENTKQALATTRKDNAADIEKAKQTVRNAKSDLDQAKDVWQQKVREVGDQASSAQTIYSNVVAAEATWEAAKDALDAAITTAKTLEQTAQNNVDSAQAAYDATLQASSQVAGLSSLQALENSAHLTLSKRTMYAPFSGTITDITNEPGEVVVGASSFMQLETAQDLELTSNVPEIDAVKVQPGMRATVTFDAYGTTQTWEAAVRDVAVGFTILDGVPTYETTLALKSPNTDLKPGLSANITVHAAQRENALSIPRRALIQEGVVYKVRVLLEDGTIETRDVTVDLIGSEGTVAIQEGVQEGDAVVIGEIE